MVKAFFRKLEENNLLPFLFFLLVSCCLWLLQTLNEKYETDVAFRVNIKRLPADVQVDGDDAYFMARIRDYGTALIGYEFGSAIQVDVDYDKLQFSNGRLLLPLSQVKQNVENSISSSTTLVRFLQDTLVLDVKRSMALLPVKIDGVIDAAEHYAVAEIEIVPSEVNVIATDSELDGIVDVRTEYVVKKYLKNSVGFKVPLVSGNLMTVEPSVVDVYVTVHPLVSKKVHVPVRYMGFPIDMQGKFPHEVLVSYEVPEPDADDVGADNFVVSVDYDEIVDSGSDNAEFSVLSSSHKVRNIQLSPSRINIK